MAQMAWRGGSNKKFAPTDTDPSAIQGCSKKAFRFLLLEILLQNQTNYMGEDITIE